MTTTTTTSTTKTCGCGCGAEVKRTYLPGHDAKHKAQLVAAIKNARNGQDRDRAIDALLAKHWERFAPAEALHEYKVRVKGVARIHIDEIEVFLVDANGDHHARQSCGCLTKVARKNGHVHPVTRLASEAAITRVEATDELRHSLKHGWDACPACTIDWTMQEAVETVIFKMDTVASLADAAKPGDEMADLRAA